MYYNPYTPPVEVKNVIEYTTDNDSTVSFGGTFRDTGGSDIKVASYLYDNNGSKLLITSNKYENGIGKLTLSDNPVKFDRAYFAGYQTLYTITFPSTITSVPAGCITYSSVTVLTFKSVVPPSIIFTDSNSYYSDKNWLYESSRLPENLTIYVPSTSLDAYKKAQYWSYYANYIKPIS